MTMPFERSLAVKRAEKFLMKLLDRKQSPRVPLDIRREARAILKHFPAGFYIDEAAKKAPDVFGAWPE
jgi:hypothetical protein